MQPQYLSLTSTGSSPWKSANTQLTPQQITFAVISTGGSSYFISVALEDPSGAYQSPNYSSTVGSTGVTAFTAFTGSSNAFVTLGSSATFPVGAPITGYQFTLNTQSSAGARVTCVCLQSGID